MPTGSHIWRNGSMPERIHVDSRSGPARGYSAVVSLRGEHDLATMPALRVALAPLCGDVLVDLTDCDFIDSSVIGVLVEKHGELRRDDHGLELVVPGEGASVRRIITVTGLHSMLAVHEAVPACENLG